eukprot:2495158-Rhodomonas_salina.4
MHRKVGRLLRTCTTKSIASRPPFPSIWFPFSSIPLVAPYAAHQYHGRPSAIVEIAYDVPERWHSEHLEQ